MSTESVNAAPARTSHRRVWPLRRIWLGAFLGFFLVFGAWSFAAPFDAPADEVQHVIRAAGVVSGQIAPAPVVIDNWNGKGADGMGAMQQVPEGLHSPATCWGFEPSRSAACAEPIHGGPVESVPTSAGRYNPTYYLAVGLPVRLWPGWGGLVLSRLLSAALSAALLAFAFALLVRWSRFGLMLAGLVAVSTPMLAHLAGAVNPNGIEISAGIALFAAGIPMLFDKGSFASKRPLFWLFGVSAVILALVRSLGPVWLVCALAALLLGISRNQLRELWNYKLTRYWGYGIGAALLASAAWILLMRTGEVVPPGGNEVHTYTFTSALMEYFESWDIYIKGMVGVAGWFDIFMPLPFYWIWAGCAISLMTFALIVGSWTDRARFGIIAFGAMVIPGILQVAKADVIGFIIGGRYMLPLMAGAPLLAAYVLEKRLFNSAQTRTLVRFFAVTLLPIHMFLLLWAMVRWQRGQNTVDTASRYNFLAGSWHPPTGSLLPVLCMVAGIIVLGVVFWRGPSWALNYERPDQAEPAEEASPTDSAVATPATAEAPAASTDATAATFDEVEADRLRLSEPSRN